MNVMSRKISCKQAVDFISKKEEGRLTASQRFSLWRHLAGCSLCRIFSVQNRIIGEAVKQSEARDLSPIEKEALVKAVLQSEQ